MTYAQLLLEFAKANTAGNVAEGRRRATAFLQAVELSLATSPRLCIPGFGTFHRGTRKARRVRNPATGEWLELPKQVSIRFRPARRLKAKLQEPISPL